MNIQSCGQKRRQYLSTAFTMGTAGEKEGERKRGRQRERQREREMMTMMMMMYLIHETNYV